MRLLSIAIVSLLAGCAAPGEAPPEPLPEPASEPLADPWDGRDRIPVAQRDVATGGIVEFDILCTSGGTAFYELPGDEAAPNDTSAFEFVVRSGATTTGVQAGHSTGGDITWLDVVVQDEATFITDADAPQEWRFHYQINVAAQQECYTGASLGDYSIQVSAVR